MAGLGRLTLDFIWQNRSKESFLDLKIFHGLKLIGETKNVPGKLYSEGLIHNESFQIIQSEPKRLPPLVKLTIQKEAELAGRMEWSIGGNGNLYLLKRKRGANNFLILLMPDSTYAVCEKDQQVIGTICVGSQSNFIWSGGIVTRQRPLEQVHEIMLYAVILIRTAFPPPR